MSKYTAHAVQGRTDAVLLIGDVADFLKPKTALCRFFMSLQQSAWDCVPIVVPHDADGNAIANLLYAAGQKKFTWTMPHDCVVRVDERGDVPVRAKKVGDYYYPIQWTDKQIDECRGTRTVKARFLWSNGDNATISIPEGSTSEDVAKALVAAGVKPEWFKEKDACVVVGDAVYGDQLKTVKVGDRYYLPYATPKMFSWYNANTGVTVTLPDTASKEDILRAIVKAGVTAYPYWHPTSVFFARCTDVALEHQFTPEDFQRAKA